MSQHQIHAAMVERRARVAAEAEAQDLRAQVADLVVEVETLRGALRRLSSAVEGRRPPRMAPSLAIGQVLAWLRRLPSELDTEAEEAARMLEAVEAEYRRA